MAKYDQGGGCACGLRKICDCGSGQADGRSPNVRDYYNNLLSRNEEKKMNTDNDFGFTFSDGSDLPEVSQAKEHATKITKSTNDALESVLSAVNTFLDNLQKEPEKKYLLWPDRAAKVKQFQDKINFHLAN